MKSMPFLCALFIITISSPILGQTIIHPWQVIDRGGNTSTAGSMTLQSSIGQPAVQAMAATGKGLESGYIPGLRTYVSALDVTNDDGWNMISVPVITDDFRKTVLYPGANSSAFAYQGSYVQRDTLKNGTGYWLKFSSAGVTHVTGGYIARETINVADKWNMIGTLSQPVLISDITPIPPTTITSNYFGYTAGSGYLAEDTLKPGKGYWIKVNNAGKIILTTGSVIEPMSVAQGTSSKKTRMNSIDADQHQLHVLTLTDAKGREGVLYFSGQSSDIDPGKYELPPLPPPGIFDIRYSNNQTLALADGKHQKESAIRISSAEFPLTLSWKNAIASQDALLLVDGKEIQMKGEGTTQIPYPVSHITLHLMPVAGNELPKTFALYQNYPNPFNPSTTIRYDLPRDAHVRIILYDALGREVKTVVDEDQDAGFKSVVWNSTNNNGNTISSGVYYYKLVAGTFTEVRKLMLLK